MSDVFVIRNQLGHYWSKSKAWVDGTEPRAVMRLRHEDEAVNTLFELSSRDFELRGEIIRAQLSERGEPVVEPSEHLLPKESEEPEQQELVEQTDTQDDTPPETSNSDGAAQSSNALES